MIFRIGVKAAMIAVVEFRVIRGLQRARVPEPSSYHLRPIPGKINRSACPPAKERQEQARAQHLPRRRLAR